MVEWVMRIARHSVQDNGHKRRTVGTYEVLHDGAPIRNLSGATAESPGPSENDRPATKQDPRRILAGRYKLKTHIGPHYATIGYRDDPTHPVPLMPALQIVMPDNRRTDILIHPGKYEFLSSIGCINLCTDLPDPSELIDFQGSRKRVIAIIDDLRASATGFPKQNNREIDNAWVVIEGEPGDAAAAKD